MSWTVRKPFVLVTYGTSLTTGRLSSQWPERLQQGIRGAAECVGPVIVYNMGKGSQTSVWGKDNAYIGGALNPTHILSEGFAINDCALGVSQPDHLTNMGSMRSTWLSYNPDVDITWQTMSSVSTAIAVGRPALASYYADEMTFATSNGDTKIDNYLGAGGSYPGPVGGWVKPLPDVLTYDSDGLHPIWTGSVETYLWPNVYWWARVKMAEFWGLPAPT
jgi:hypothetical protein